jgi:hypothetical protein
MGAEMNLVTIKTAGVYEFIVDGFLIHYTKNKQEFINYVKDYMDNLTLAGHVFTCDFQVEI